jgi:hypothetical protein
MITMAKKSLEAKDGTAGGGTDQGSLTAFTYPAIIIKKTSLKQGLLDGNKADYIGTTKEFLLETAGLIGGKDKLSPHLGSMTGGVKKRYIFKL